MYQELDVYGGEFLLESKGNPNYIIKTLHRQNIMDFICHNKPMILENKIAQHGISVL